MDEDQLNKLIIQTQKKMEKAAKELDFIQAAQFRDELAELKKMVEQKRR
jgi:excinuclease ABC subunit B